MPLTLTSDGTRLDVETLSILSLFPPPPSLCVCVCVPAKLQEDDDTC